MVRSCFIFFLVLVSCGRGFHEVDLDQNSEKPKIITFSWLAARVFAPNCISCHGELEYKSKGGGIPLYSYDHFVIEAETVWKEILRDRMPKEGRKLTTVEKSWVQEWFDTEMPE